MFGGNSSEFSMGFCRPVLQMVTSSKMRLFPYPCSDLFFQICRNCLSGFVVAQLSLSPFMVDCRTVVVVWCFKALFLAAMVLRCFRVVYNDILLFDRLPVENDMNKIDVHLLLKEQPVSASCHSVNQRNGNSDFGFLTSHRISVLTSREENIRKSWRHFAFAVEFNVRCFFFCHYNLKKELIILLNRIVILAALLKQVYKGRNVINSHRLKTVTKDRLLVRFPVVVELVPTFFHRLICCPLQLSCHVEKKKRSEFCWCKTWQVHFSWDLKTRFDL